MRDEQKIGFAATMMLLAVLAMATPPGHARPAQLSAVLEAMTDVLTCTEADPRICTIRTLP